VPAPEKLTIETPEQIALEFPLAGVGSRFLALAFDSLLQAGGIVALIVIGLILRAVAGIAPPLRGLGVWGIALLFAAGFLIYSAYFAVFEAVWSGQTPGKRLVRLRVIDASGRPMTVYSAIVRNLLRLIDQIPGFYALGILSVLVTSRQQRLGDLAAGTVVVHERIDEAVVTPPVARGASRHGAHKLTAAEAALIEGFLQRRAELDAWVRLDQARRITAHMKQRLELASEDDDERLLEQLASEYRSSGAYR
jgi:uncharacterized RDD family membrane protein YckC